MIKLIHGDCLEEMKKLPNNHIDLTVTSPPYDELRDYINDGYIFDFEVIAKELFRITKEGGVLVWVVGDQTTNGSESGTSFKQALYFKEIGFNLHDTMIYKKKGFSFPDKIRYNSTFEYMFVFLKNKPKTINLIKDKKNIWVGSKVARFSGDRNKNGKMTNNSAYKNNKNKKVYEFGVRDNVWEYSTGKNCSTKDEIAFEHPAIFPERLAEDHIISWSNPGDLVFDPFMGSGTTGKMSKINDRHFIGTEVSKKYFDIATERINNTNRLFEGIKC